MTWFAITAIALMFSFILFKRFQAGQSSTREDRAGQHGTVEEKGGVWIYVPPPDGFRTRESHSITCHEIDEVVENGARFLVVDLSSIKLGFYDDGVFGHLIYTECRFQKEKRGNLVVVKPPKKVRDSFEFQPTYNYLHFADSVSDAVSSLEQKKKETSG